MMKTTKRKYQLADGSTIEATSAAEFVRKLREGSRFHSVASDVEFMQGFARRYKELHGIELDTSDVEAFFEDLIAKGYIKRVDID